MEERELGGEEKGERERERERCGKIWTANKAKARQRYDHCTAL